MRPALLLRIQFPASGFRRPQYDSDFQHYSGGDLIDEIAALCSLIVGARMVSGSLRREFGPSCDPLGDPRGWAEKPSPYLDIDHTRLIVPRAFTNVDASHFLAIDRIGRLVSAASVALVQSARLYQQALLLCETSPELAWLMLVSAIEVVANRHSSQETTALDRFRQAHPDLAEKLTEHLELELLLAERMATLTKSGQKFRSFLTQFCPQPPEHRPPPAYQVEMTGSGFTKVINRVYACCSQHLHGGVAIPEPMCQPPEWFSFPDHPGAGYNEKPLGLGQYAKGASWQASDCPMLLQHFEYIARGAILNWWRSMDDELSFGPDERERVSKDF